MNTRAVAGAAVVITGMAVAYSLAQLLGMQDPDWAYLPRGIIHLGELAAVVALALCGAAGNGPLARIGLGAAGVGSVLMAVAEVITESSPGVSDTLFAVAPVLVGLGLVMAGVAIIRTGAWRGWHRYLTLALGIYVFLVLTPAIIISGGPPAAGALAAIAVWDLMWALIAVSVLTGTARRSTVAAPPV